MTSLVTTRSAEPRLRVLAAAPLLHRAFVPATAVWCVAARTFVAGTWAGYSHGAIMVASIRRSGSTEEVRGVARRQDGSAV
jgi:hypothetical protein